MTHPDLAGARYHRMRRHRTRSAIVYGRLIVPLMDGRSLIYNDRACGVNDQPVSSLELDAWRHRRLGGAEASGEF